MPEAPEVQNILNYLQEQLQDAEIERVEITHPKLIQNMAPAEFEEKLARQHLRAFSRRGKYLILETDDYDWIAHMRMEGRFFIYDQLPEDEKITKHLHAKFWLSDGRILAYHDTRKFGRMALYDKVPDPQRLEIFQEIGPDVLSDSFTASHLLEKLARRKCAIKTALLDQSVVAGIGNIYADEILFQAGLDPRSVCSHLDLQDCSRIVEASRDILSRAIEAKGTTIRTFAFDGSHAGSFQEQLQVHDREQQPCLRCSGTVEKIMVGQRSTFVCPGCQIRK